MDAVIHRSVDWLPNARRERGRRFGVHYSGLAMVGLSNAVRNAPGLARSVQAGRSTS
jgi:hypothetical protein